MDALSICFAAVLVIGVVGLLALLEAFIGWAGWREQPNIGKLDKLERLEPLKLPKETPEHFIIFLDGVSKGSYRDVKFVEDFLVALKTACSESRIIHDVLPYSILDLSLTDETYPFSRFWRWVEVRKQRGNPLGFLINIHNIFQVMVSADWRYGLVYNMGMAKLLLRHLIQHGYQPQSNVPVILVAYSGGAQVAAGAAPLVKQVLASPVSVISLAGVMSGAANFAHIGSWHQLMSNRDPVEKIGAIVFPLRWRFVWFSNWNRAKRRGTVKFVHLDGARHDGERGYLDSNVLAPDGQPLLTRTVAVISKLVRQAS